jgi:hypothetical protein
VHVYFDNLLGCLERVARGEAVALAVSDVKRDPRIPAVPTLIECGFPEHALDVWLAVFGANLDAAALERLGAEAAAVARLEQRVERSRAQWTRAPRRHQRLRRSRPAPSVRSIASPAPKSRSSRIGAAMEHQPHRKPQRVQTHGHRERAQAQQVGDAGVVQPPPC